MLLDTEIKRYKIDVFIDISNITIYNGRCREILCLPFLFLRRNILINNTDILVRELSRKTSASKVNKSNKKLCKLACVAATAAVVFVPLLSIEGLKKESMNSNAEHEIGILVGEDGTKYIPVNESVNYSQEEIIELLLRK